MKKILILLFAIIIFNNPVSVFGQASVNYELAWPGILPDNKLYKLKVIRNKILEKMIIYPVDKVKFDLLMADKTIYASKLLVEKREISLAKDTALKGENYYSQLVQNYNQSLLRDEKIPKDLDKRITMAAQKHQQIFLELAKRVSQTDSKAFYVAENFSEINFKFIEGLRNTKNKK